MKTLKKAALFGDIHFGKRSNSPQHNADCIDFISWMCDVIKGSGDIDHVIFLGDWHENRNALNISTMNFSYTGAKMLDSLNMPIYFCVGNHDLFHRHTRELHSTINFTEFKNFTIINDITVCSDMEGGVLLCPYLFDAEYESLKQYLPIPVWIGHFEFKGFVITGYNTVMASGPDPSEFFGPKHILSGHFHKRQTMGNVTYIGNAFPMDFGDVDDNKRGIAVIDHTDHSLSFVNWADCPVYIKAPLSTILSLPTSDISKKARIRCTVDIPITYEESNMLKQTFSDGVGVREFCLEELGISDDILTNTDTEIDPSDAASVDDLVVKMLGDIKSDDINSTTLIDIYKNIKFSG